MSGFLEHAGDFLSGGKRPSEFKRDGLLAGLTARPAARPRRDDAKGRGGPQDGLGAAGHSNIRITADLYTHAVRSADVDAAERMQRALRG
jgi:hypothetical protein